MKGFTLVVCLALVAPAVLAIRDQCEAGNLSPGYYPHSQYCNKFYSCVFETLYEHTCVSPFLWNNDAQNCDFPENVQCGDLIVPQKRFDVSEMAEETPQTAQGCPCAQGCVGADEDSPTGACGCGCAGAATGACPGGCPGGCGCGCAGVQGGCAGAAQQPCPQVPGNAPGACCGCNIPQPPLPVDIVRRMAQAIQPPSRPCGCQPGNNFPRPELSLL